MPNVVKAGVDPDKFAAGQALLARGSSLSDKDRANPLKELAKPTEAYDENGVLRLFRQEDAIGKRVPGKEAEKEILLQAQLVIAAVSVPTGVQPIGRHGSHTH